MSSKKINSALISVYYKDGLEPIARLLHGQGVQLYSTGGTQTFLEKLNIPVTAVEDLTGYPSILGGRVKTLHPKVFGGILSRRDDHSDQQQVSTYEIPPIDLVIVDLYPFEETVAAGAGEEDIIEKIDIGGISLIRAAAKNFGDVVIISSRLQYAALENLLREKNGETSLAERKRFAGEAFDITSHYDSAIFNYFNTNAELPSYKVSLQSARKLRYGENPHQSGYFHGDLDAMFEQLNGKELSYNNLVDIDAAVMLIGLL
jgi:phosphoribosylaminoimidazolecarboxamide formyltransferase/IMP cyclohydrolase